MNCQSIMKSDAVCIDKSDTVRHAAQLMRDRNVGFLPICEERRVVGTVTDRDLVLRVLADDKASNASVSMFAQGKLVSCKPGTTLDEAHDLMTRNHVSRLVCCGDGGELLGVISFSDVAKHSTPERTGQTVKRFREERAHLS